MSFDAGEVVVVVAGRVVVVEDGAGIVEVVATVVPLFAGGSSGGMADSPQAVGAAGVGVITDTPGTGAPDEFSTEAWIKGTAVELSTQLTGTGVLRVSSPRV